jgi:hypothetical protein
MTELPERYVEITAAFAVNREFAPAFDLLLGVHPEQQRHLTEEEEYAINLLRYCEKTDLLNSQIKAPSSSISLALLWLKYFPDIQGILSTTDQDLYRLLWKSALENAEPLKLAYAFYPTEFYSEQGVLQRKRVKDEATRLQMKIENLTTDDSRARGKVVWTLPFPAGGPLGQLVEERAGLSSALKKRIGLTSYSPGLLCNYLLGRNIAVEHMLDKDQFEDLAGIVFSEEGWSVEKTPKTRDGGKDIIARKIVSGTPIIAYVEAKRYKQTRKIRISQVKEFVATVAGDKADRGFLVTSSFFSKPSLKWLQEKGAALALVECIDRKVLESRLKKIADAETAAYLFHC